MEKFRNTLRLTTNQITAAPISEGRSYFDIEKNILYRDSNGQRYALAETLKVNDLNQDFFENQDKLKNLLIINKKEETPGSGTYTYQLIYITEDGELQDLETGGGGGVYTAGTGINISLENIVSVDSTVVRLIANHPNYPTVTQKGPLLDFIQLGVPWVIDSIGDDFKITQKDFPTNGTNKDIIIIYKETSGNNPDAKVEIKNAKTSIEDLDFGIW